MGMLMHHTWLEQQKKAKPVETKPVEPAEVKEEKPVEEPVKKTGGRRKTK